MTNIELSEKARASAPAIAPPRLPYHPALQERFGVGQAEWRALVDAVFPMAKETSSVILALSYCKARKLDPFKKPVHIVPVYNSALKRMVETVWPGIGELRTTAFRTGLYAGRDEARYGETKTEKVGNALVTYPEWCQVTVYRLVNGERMPFPGPRVWWLETYATAGRDDQSPNAMWKKRAFGQIDKCAEAAALRVAFPEEVGNEYAAEEMQGQTLDGTVSESGEVTITAPKSLAARLDALAGVDAETGELLETDAALASRGHASEAAGSETPIADPAADDGDSFAGQSSAWRFGYAAQETGIPRDNWPADFDPDEVDEWRAGWDAAKASGK